jgi:hypothetical protein
VLHPSKKLIVIDLDATDDPLHGAQEGRFFHGYYREYCYLPLYFFCGDFLLCARLRTADKQPANGTLLRSPSGRGRRPETREIGERCTVGCPTWMHG